jgi:hypothetical protein
MLTSVCIYPPGDLTEAGGLTGAAAADPRSAWLARLGTAPRTALLRPAGCACAISGSIR